MFRQYLTGRRRNSQDNIPVSAFKNQASKAAFKAEQQAHLEQLKAKEAALLEQAQLQQRSVETEPRASAPLEPEQKTSAPVETKTDNEALQPQQKTSAPVETKTDNEALQPQQKTSAPLETKTDNAALEKKRKQDAFFKRGFDACMIELNDRARQMRIEIQNNLEEREVELKARLEARLAEKEIEAKASHKACIAEIQKRAKVKANKRTCLTAVKAGVRLKPARGMLFTEPNNMPFTDAHKSTFTKLRNHEFSEKEAFAMIDGLTVEQVGGIVKGLSREEVLALKNAWQIEALVSFQARGLTVPAILAFNPAFDKNDYKELKSLINNQQYALALALEKLHEIRNQQVKMRKTNV